MYTPLDALTAEHAYRQERLLAERIKPGPRRIRRRKMQRRAISAGSPQLPPTNSPTPRGTQQAPAPNSTSARPPRAPATTTTRDRSASAATVAAGQR